MYCLCYTVSPEGSIEISPKNISTTFNSLVSLTCSALGGPENVFEWRKKGEVISTSPVLEFTMITSSDGAVYQCTVSNAAGNDTTTATITGKQEVIV